MAAGYRINRIILEFKVLSSLHHQAVFKVLIESYWNLKGLKIAVATCFEISINRIILEFKGERREVFRTLGMCINRIILEFKAVNVPISLFLSYPVLIESYWNLKLFRTSRAFRPLWY